MFLQYRTQGLILKKEDRGEADQLFTTFTRDFGKLEILGKAIRKITSKLRSGAEIFFLSEIEFIQGKAQKTLTDAILIDKFENLRKDLKKLKIAYKISEVFDNLIRGQELDEKIWHLLTEVFKKLNNCQIVKLSNCQLLFYYFLWNLVSILGYQPELFHCPLCRKKLLPEKLYFSSKEGGIICAPCQKSVKSAKEISPDAVKILRILFKKDLAILEKLKIEKSHLETLKIISADYYSHILGELK
jgi:DNA repair protein RecO (recombination protein O)